MAVAIALLAVRICIDILSSARRFPFIMIGRCSVARFAFPIPIAAAGCQKAKNRKYALR